MPWHFCWQRRRERQTASFSRLTCDSKEASFHGPGAVAFDGIPVFQVNDKASKRFRATDSTEGGAKQNLPPPLNSVSYDLGTLAEHFTLAECNHYPEGKSTSGGRLVDEETLVWTLQAKRAMKGDALFRLLHPNPFPDPFARVRFQKSVDGKAVSADARTNGYSLIRDIRWINLKTAPDLAAGDKLQVWIHLGKEGSAGLLESKATRLVVVAKADPH